MKRLLISIGAAFLRRSPFERGRDRLVSVLLPWLRELGPSMGTRTIQTRHGFRFCADLGDWLGQYVFLTGTYEPPTATLFSHLVKPGDTVLDVGANVGFFSLLCAELTGKTGVVVAFEPVPSVRQRLLANISLNEYDHIRVVGNAVSDRSETLSIYEGPDGHKGTSSLRPNSTATEVIEVNAIALDHDDIASTPVACIKIDVEGAEMRALEGMEQLLRRERPFLIIEFTDEFLRGFGHSTSQMSDWLTSRGYSLFLIDDDCLKPLDGSEGKRPSQYNVLACQAVPLSCRHLVRSGTPSSPGS